MTFIQVYTLIICINGTICCIIGSTKLQTTEDAQTAADLIHSSGLVREHVPSQLLNNAIVWSALLDKMPMTAMIRNLAKMTTVGLFDNNVARTQLIVDRVHLNFLPLIRLEISPSKRN